MRKKNKTSHVYIIGAVACAMIAGFYGGRLYESRTHSNPPGIHGRSGLRDEDAGLRLERHVDFIGRWQFLSFRIVNTSSEPLVVDSVVFNEEFSSHCGMYVDPGVVPAAHGFPVTLSIGDSVYGIKSNLDRSIEQYSKEVLFVDVYTNRGVFRFDSTGTLIN